MTEQTQQIHGIFPCPIYIAKRDTNLSPKEEKEIRKIIDKEGMYRNAGNSTSNNTNIFNGKLKKIKQFCEQQIKIYVEQIICPVEGDLDFYITQSWLNVNRPGESHYEHCHSNSIISGVFYISTEEDDKIFFADSNVKLKDQMMFASKESSVWNSAGQEIPSVTNELILFPSWLNHMVVVNEKATTDRISLSFNVFAKGSIGDESDLTKAFI